METQTLSLTQFPVFTIGHSNHSLEEFLKLLVRHGVEEVADVRSAPYSRYTPQFNHENLQRTLDDIGILYTYLGGELGGRPADRSCYDVHGRVMYDKVAATDIFEDGVHIVVRAADERRITLLCTEKEPLECHRTLLVSRALAERGISVSHIAADGSLEQHDAAMTRLVETHKLPVHGDMFRTPEDVVVEALELQARKFAYVSEQPTVRPDEWADIP